MSFVPPAYNPASGIVMLKGRDEVLAYYEQFRPAQMESFARFALAKGHGATTPHGIKNAAGVKVAETWQACGRRLFGERFIDVMARLVDEHKTAAAPPRAPPPPIADPDF